MERGIELVRCLVLRGKRNGSGALYELEREWDYEFGYLIFLCSW